ncbi:MAG: hypothetical protein U5L96_17430 [Owenweeksia sp.]|nr:hypothetical protein [Owenweeksia sp.]
MVLSDECGIDSLGLDRSNFNCADIGLQTITLTVKDASGNADFTTATVNVLDTTPPAINGQNLIVYLNAIGQVTITASDVAVAITDSCGLDTIVLDRYSFNCADVRAQYASDHGFRCKRQPGIG